MKNKLIALVLLLMLFIMTGCTAPQNDFKTSIIPKPVKLIQNEGFFRLTKHTKIIYDQSDLEGKRIAQMLVKKFNGVTGWDLVVEEKKTLTKEKQIIIFTTQNKLNIKGNEAYDLDVTKERILVRANESNGLFYGMQTICQLLPPEIESKEKVNDIDWVIPAVYIEDYPKFSWRGMHLDVGRHFFPKEFIKKYIDYIAFHKMNTFHWHLTEDQGWRIEIEKYPKLAEISAWRDETIIGHLLEKPRKYDGKRYGGFYTKEDLLEIVEYAKERYITVVPEIEMPGHSVEVLAAYPELGCTGGPYEVFTRWGVIDDVFCAGNEATFEFLENVLTEVLEIFPSEYIHIGGDECPKTRWKACPKCQKRIKEEGLKDEHELQSYFIKRIEKFLNSKGRKIIGWDEILEGGIAPNAAVMSWRGTEGGEKAAKKGHYVVMTPYTHCYFDHYQGPAENELLAIHGMTTLQEVYSYHPIPKSLSDDEKKYILGAQGNVWTEYIPNEQHVEYMAIPRMTALAEVLWTPESDRNWNDFLDRLDKQFDRFELMKINYSKSIYKNDTTSIN